MKRYAAMFLLILAASARAEVESDDPAAELASFQVADGFEVNLFASEKDGVVKPIQIRFDPKGRLWVIGSTVYPQIQPGQRPNDKVLILEDTDRDGKCDKTTVFADGLMIPTGIELIKDGAFVGHGTELLLLRDADGDGKADERKVLLRGFGTGDTHQNINSFLWGPGGELWMCQGLHTHSHVETPWGGVHMEKAGLWRLRPRLMKLEGFYGSEAEPQNPWGYAFTDWGEPLVMAGNNSSSIYPVPGLIARHRDAAPPLIWKNGLGRKSSGADLVGTTHFPDSWQGALIVGGYINNAVWTLKISDDGAGFSLEDLPPLIKSTSRKFRPVDAKFGPDGALYLCDWYNPIIGHYQASFRHPDRDKTHGRIWRVTAKGRPLTTLPQLADASIPELLDKLKSTDRWTRHFAARVLADRDTGEVTKELDRWANQSGLSELALCEALGIYQAHERPTPWLLDRLCAAKEPGARARAASVIGLWADRLADPLSRLKPLLSDPNPRVRLQAVVACAAIPQSEAMEVAAIAADFPADKFIDYALEQAVFALKPYWLPALRKGQLNLENKMERLSLLVHADRSPDTLTTIRDLLKGPESSATMRETFLRLLSEYGSSEDLRTVLLVEDEDLQRRILPLLPDILRGRPRPAPAGVSDRLKALARSRQPEIRAPALQLAAVWKLNAFSDAAPQIAADGNETVEVRRAAIEILALDRQRSGSLLETLAAEAPPLVRSAAIGSITGYNLERAARLAAAALGVISNKEAQEEIFTSFLIRKNGPGKLLDALRAASPSLSSAKAGLELMSGGGRRDQPLAAFLSELEKPGAARDKLTIPNLERFAAEVRTRGNAKAGQGIFERAELGCIQCHTVQGRGGAIGPDLSALGTAQPIDFIVGAILDPQKEVKEGFSSVAVTTKDAEEYQGYIVRDSGAELVLRDPLQRKEIRLPREQIAQKRQLGSIMPAGLVDALSAEEFRDLVAYLSQLGKIR